LFELLHSSKEKVQITANEENETFFVEEEKETEIDTKSYADPHQLLEKPCSNGFRCQLCYDYIINASSAKWVGCARCHHVSQAHGIQENVGIIKERKKFKHICPVVDKEFFMCTSLKNCPTNLLKRHRMELNNAKIEMKKKNSISIKLTDIFSILYG